MYTNGGGRVKLGAWTTGCLRYAHTCNPGLSISVWLLFPTFSGSTNDGVLTTTINSNSANGIYLLAYSSGKLYWGCRDPVRDRSEGNVYYNAYTTNTWTHYVFTMKFNTNSRPDITAYINGIETTNFYTNDGTRSGSAQACDTIVLGGRYRDASGYHVRVKFDDLIFFENILSQNEAAMIYDHQSV